MTVKVIKKKTKPVVVPIPVIPEIEPCEIEKVLTHPTQIDTKNNVEYETVGNILTLRQQRFCELYATDRQFFGNWVQCYLEIYDIDQEQKGWYKTACVCASQLLSNPKVYNRINELLSSDGLNDQFIDKQLLMLISQQDDKNTKMAAIREYNNLKQRITKKIEHSWAVSVMRELSTEELEKKLLEGS